MLVLVPPVSPVMLSVLLTVGGWLMGIVLWMLLGKLEAFSRRIGARSYSEERFGTHLFRSAGRELFSRRKDDDDGLVR